MELNDFKLNELGETLWHNKYQNNEETFDQWLDRVSGGDEDVKNLIVQKKFLFGGRILASRGVMDRKVTYSNCYVLPPVGDSIEDIYSTASDLARTFSYGGGCGIDISQLRPKGSPVNNAARTTSGAVSFMETFSQVSQTIGQQGRRGALMISMDCNHPDVADFIDAKKNTDKLEGCNISVRTDQQFMERAQFSDTKEYELFKQLALNNWDYAEPGILYWDNITSYNMLSEYINNGEFEYAGVNPCAEEPLPAGGSCLLGALNLAEFVEDEFTDMAVFNVPEFKTAVKTAVKALNDVLDEGLELHPLPIQKQTVGDWRQIGLGIMGFGDLLVKLGIPYGSQRCLDLIKTIGYSMVHAGLRESARLAGEKGTFNMYEEDRIVNSTFIQELVSDTSLLSYIKENGLRNSQIFTIAPTGTISTMLGVSGGVEPIFDIKYTRTTKSLHDKDVDYEVFTPIALQCLEKYGITSENVDQVGIPKELVTAKMLNPKERIDVQAQWQKFIDASISSTVNLTNEVTPEDVEMLYMYAWLHGCKGLTIYRDGCARTGILNSKPKKQPQPQEVPDVTWDDNQFDTTIENCIARGSKIQTGCGSLWITAYFHKVTGQLCHIFLNKGSKGGCNSYMVGLSRMISLAGKKGASIQEIIDQLNSVIACPSFAVAKTKDSNVAKGSCCPAAIGRELKRLYDEHMEYLTSNQVVIKMDASMITTTQIPIQSIINTNDGAYPVACPTCGGVLQFTGGCNTCPDCGWSKCE